MRKQVILYVIDQSMQPLLQEYFISLQILRILAQFEPLRI